MEAGAYRISLLSVLKEYLPVHPVAFNELRGVPIWHSSLGKDHRRSGTGLGVIANEWCRSMTAKFPRCAHDQRGRVHDPISSRLAPKLPTLRKTLVEKHGPHIRERQSWLSVQCPSSRTTAQKGKEQAELSRRADKIVFAHKLGELLFQWP